MPDRGSILLEQLVAMGLMSLMLVGLFSLLTAGALGAQMSSELSLAGGLAAQKLEEIAGSREEPTNVPRQPLDSERFPRYEWQADVTDVDVALRQVTVTVWWQQRGRERSVSLTTFVWRSEER